MNIARRFWAERRWISVAAASRQPSLGVDELRTCTAPDRIFGESWRGAQAGILGDCRGSSGAGSPKPGLTFGDSGLDFLLQP
jgi:hypothetical protein